MNRTLENLQGLIGNTPLIKITYKFNGEIKNAFMKAEWFNMSGSIKDRVAFSIIRHAYETGALEKGKKLPKPPAEIWGFLSARLAHFWGIR